MRFKYLPELLAIVILVSLMLLCLYPWRFSRHRPFPDPEKWEVEATYWDHGDRVVIYRPKGSVKKLKWGPKR